MTENNRLPRLDLHCHLDGSLSQGCIEELLGRSVKLEELQADMDCQSLAEYLEKFEIPLECLQTEKGLERAGFDEKCRIRPGRLYRGTVCTAFFQAERVVYRAGY